jgi:WD40 repeat protein
MENVDRWNFAPDGQSILTLDRQGQVAQWSGADFHQKSPLLEMETNVSSSCFSPDGRFLAVGWTNGIIQVWNPSQRVLLYQLTNTTHYVWVLNLLADGKKLITFSGRDNFLHEWDLTTRLEIQSWPAPVAFDGASQLTPDERSFVAIGDEGEAVVRSLADASQTKVDLGVLEGYTADFSPDGKLLAVSSSLGFAKVWDAATWKPVATIGGFLNGVKLSTFSPDGKRLAIASNGKEAVRLCDTDSWQDVLTLESQGSGDGARFSPDGNDLIWRNNTTLYLWRAPSWAEINAAEAKEKAGLQQP